VLDVLPCTFGSPRSRLSAFYAIGPLPTLPPVAIAPSDTPHQTPTDGLGSCETRCQAETYPICRSLPAPKLSTAERPRRRDSTNPSWHACSHTNASPHSLSHYSPSNSGSLLLEHFYFYCATYPELLKQFRQSLAVTLPISLDIAS
jgi:hypothetical protein